MPAALLIVFLVWDFGFAPLGILEPHLLLMVALVWFGVVVARLPQDQWLGRRSDGSGLDSAILAP